MKSKLGFPRSRPVSLLDFRLNPISDDDVVLLVNEAIENGRRYIIGNHNLHSVYLWYHESKMRRFYEVADYTHIDGMFLILLGNLLGLPLGRQNRATSLDFFPLLAEKATTSGWRIFYLGSKPGVAENASDKLRKRYGGLQIQTHHGHFDAAKSSKDNKKVLEEIRAYAPHILLVGMGMPRQEIWILENQQELEANVIFPAGAFMDYMAGAIPTAPRWLASIYLEWLYRLICEPARLWRRYLVEPWFVLGQITKRYLKADQQNILTPGSRHE